jgi:hypothetical protein
MDNTKLVQSASLLDRVLVIMQGLTAAVIIASAVFIPLTAVLGEKVIADASSLTLGSLKFNLNGSVNFLDIQNFKSSIICSLACAILAAAATRYCIKVLREILAPMIEGIPFAAGISNKIRKLAWAVLVGGFITEIGHAITASLEIKAYQIERLFNLEAISSVSYNFSLNLWFVITAMILFFLSYVFRCGEMLQKESDETL